MQVSEKRESNFKIEVDILFENLSQNIKFEIEYLRFKVFLLFLELYKYLFRT